METQGDCTEAGQSAEPNGLATQLAAQKSEIERLSHQLSTLVQGNSGRSARHATAGRSAQHASVDGDEFDDILSVFAGSEIAPASPSAASSYDPELGVFDLSQPVQPDDRDPLGLEESANELYDGASGELGEPLPEPLAKRIEKACTMPPKKEALDKLVDTYKRTPNEWTNTVSPRNLSKFPVLCQY